MQARKTTFLGAQFRYLFRSFPSRTKLWHRFYFFYEIFRLLARYLALRLALHQHGPKISDKGKTCVVVLLSHNRPQNLAILVQGALQNNFVRKVIVSNSNPKFRMGDWIKIADPRLVLIDETQRTLPGHRFVLAAAEVGEYFLSVDDDIFFTPRQWAGFFECLLQDEEVPHGISGQLYRPGTLFSNGTVFHHRENIEVEVDVLIGAYAFTRVQLERVFRLADALRLGSLSDVGNGEDILLSFAGSRAPCIHNLGNPLLCASTSLRGVALSNTRENFWDERVKLFVNVRDARAAVTLPPERVLDTGTINVPGPTSGKFAPHSGIPLTGDQGIVPGNANRRTPEVFVSIQRRFTNALTRLIPEPIKPCLRRIRHILYTHIYVGGRCYCPVCGNFVRKFKRLSYGDTRCFLCTSDERHRLVYEFLRQKTTAFDGKSTQMLHVAPEDQFVPTFSKLVGCGYVTADLINPRAMVRLDLTDIHYENASFDVIYCSHVLEHIPDDRKAMRELRRVLKPDGYAIIMVPCFATVTFEDPSIVDPKDRLRLFGQEDHVRVYGPDFVDRLKDAGFDVSVISAADFLSAQDIVMMNLTIHSGDIFLCKPDLRQGGGSSELSYRPASKAL